MLVRGLPEEEREALRARLSEAFVPVAADGGYELPGRPLRSRELRTAFDHHWVLSQGATSGVPPGSLSAVGMC